MDFLNNSIILSILRLTHIFSGIIWVGFGLTAALLIHPVAKSMGEKGDTLLRMYYGYSKVNIIFPIAAILTTAAGLIMWGSPSIVLGGMDLANFTDTGDIVMVTGAVFGLLAFGHGAGATGRFSSAFGKAAQAYEETDTPSEEQKSELNELRRKLFTHANISAALTVIAAVAMSSARHLG